MAHAFADEVFGNAADSVDKGVANPSEDGFNKYANDFHLGDGAPDNDRRKDRPGGIPGTCTSNLFVYLSSGRAIAETDSMNDLEKLRQLLSPEADGWTTAQLEQLTQDIDAAAVLLLDWYRSRELSPTGKACGLSDFDVSSTDR